MIACEIKKLLQLPDRFHLQPHCDSWLLVDANAEYEPCLLNVRNKSEASWYRKGKRYEFGIPLQQAQRYQQYPNLLLCIYEAKTAQVLVGKFAELFLTARIYAQDTIDKGGTLFVRKSDMEDITTTGLQVAEYAKHRTTMNI